MGKSAQHIPMVGTQRRLGERLLGWAYLHAYLDALRPSEAQARTTSRGLTTKGLQYSLVRIGLQLSKDWNSYWRLRPSLSIGLWRNILNLYAPP